MDKIICFGKNYQDHMLELGDAPVEKPVIFLKPSSILKECSTWNSTIDLCVVNDDLNYECEFVVIVKNGGYKMLKDEALLALDSYTIGLDMTLRETQKKLKCDGHTLDN